MASKTIAKVTTLLVFGVLSNACTMIVEDEPLTLNVKDDVLYEATLEAANQWCEETGHCVKVNHTDSNVNVSWNDNRDMESRGQGSACGATAKWLTSYEIFINAEKYYADECWRYVEDDAIAGDDEEETYVCGTRYAHADHYTDLVAMMAHEIGHALHYADSDDQHSIMYGGTSWKYATSVDADLLDSYYADKAETKTESAPSRSSRVAY